MFCNDNLDYIEVAEVTLLSTCTSHRAMAGQGHQEMLFLGI
jgi:hypothetical protein